MERYVSFHPPQKLGSTVRGPRTTWINRTHELFRIRYFICRSNSIPSEDDSVFLRDDINENDLPASREATAKEKTIISSIKGRFKTYSSKNT